MAERVKANTSSKRLIITIVLLIIAIIIVKFVQSRNEAPDKESQPRHQKSSASQSPNQNTPREYRIPKEAIQTYDYALKNGGMARPNYRGNTKFGNREKRLPIKKGNITLSYKEYDIYPQVKGKNRGAERVVISSDKTGYYTNDHYKTFKEIIR